MWSAIIAAATWLFKLFFNRTPAIVQVSKDDGAQTQKSADAQQAVKTETAVANAEAEAQNSVVGVTSRLDEGTF
jgi:hypothetical protein